MSLIGTIFAASAWRSRGAEESFTCLREIVFTHDVIAIEDGPCLCPLKFIATLFRYADGDHVPHGLRLRRESTVRETFLALDRSGFPLPRSYPQSSIRMFTGSGSLIWTLAGPRI